MDQVLNAMKLPTDRNIRYLLVILVGIFTIMAIASGDTFFSLANLQSMSSQMPLLGDVSTRNGGVYAYWWY